MPESIGQTDTFIETKLEAGDLTTEVIEGLDDTRRADLVSYFIAKSTKVRAGMQVETVENPTNEGVKAQIELFRCLESISGFLNKLLGPKEGRTHAVMNNMYQARKEELEDRLSNLENPSLVTCGPETASISQAIRLRMSAQYRTSTCPETLEANAVKELWVA